MTTSQVRVVVLGSVAVVVFDILASLASRQSGIPYVYAGVASFVIYLATGFFAGRVTVSNAIGVSALSAGIAGFVDASIGWAVSWVLGPGRPLDGTQLTVTRSIGTAVFVVCLAAAVGAIGGIAGRRSASNAAAA
jgi:hypothetical protein